MCFITKQEEFGDVDPAFDVNRNAYHQSGIVGNITRNQTIISLTLLKKISQFSEQFRNLVGEKPTAQEPMVHIKRTIKYPKVSLPNPGEIYSEDAFRSFFPNDSKLEIDFDDVYNDWENYKQLPMKLIITLVYYTALLILSVFSVTNLIDITSVEIIRGFEFLILGYGIITTESNFVSSSTGIDKLTVNSINEASRIIMYF